MEHLFTAEPQRAGVRDLARSMRKPVMGLRADEPAVAACVGAGICGGYRLRSYELFQCRSVRDLAQAGGACSEAHRSYASILPLK